MKIKPINYILSNSLESLVENYFIKATRHTQYPNLVLLKYSQIDSPLGNKTVQQCRGVILDENDDWEVVAFPYSKFFNHGEGHAAAINWKTAKIYDKLDGSIMTLYFYRDQWHVSSSGSPDAAGNVGGFDIIFRDLFWRVWNELGYTLPKDTTCCYMFELMTPYNKIVVRQTKNKLVLHGARSLVDFQELEPEPVAREYGWECVKQYNFSDLDELLEACRELNPIEYEGYVVRDKKFNRIKVKSPQYVALSHFKDSMSNRRLLEIIRTNESDEFLSYFPEYEKDYRKIKSKFDKYLHEAEEVYEEIKDLPTRKEFALKAQKYPFSFALFALLTGKKKSIREALATTTIINLERSLGETNVIKR